MWGDVFGDSWPKRYPTFGNRFAGYFGGFFEERPHPFWKNAVYFPYDKPRSVSNRKKARSAENRSSSATNIPVRCQAREEPATKDLDVKVKHSSKSKLSQTPKDEKAANIQPSKYEDVSYESCDKSFSDSSQGLGKLTQDITEQSNDESSASQMNHSNSDSENVKESSPVQYGTQSAEEKKLNAIKAQLTIAKELVPRVNVFEGSRQDKEFLFLEEHLTRCILGLDVIDAGGFENVKLARKAAVKEILSVLNDLENRVCEEKLS